MLFYDIIKPNQTETMTIIVHWHHLAVDFPQDVVFPSQVLGHTFLADSASVGIETLSCKMDHKPTIYNSITVMC